MSQIDVRWIQRLNNFCKALNQLTKFIQKKDLNELEIQGLIQSFEYNFELSWNTIKDYFEAQGETDIYGSRDAFRLAFKRGLIENGELFMDMIKSRSLTSHTYNEDVVNEISKKIINEYFPQFLIIRDTFISLKEKEETL